MMKRLASVTVLAFLLQSSSVGCTTQDAFQLPAPITKLDDAIFTGIFVGDTAQFLGIPFAQPPIGSLRLQVPQPLPSYQGHHSARAYGPACHQHEPSIQRWIVPGITETSEDCLTLNVFTPAVMLPESKLPVVVFIFPGAFETGSGQSGFGSSLVGRSVRLHEPVVYVSLNYRLFQRYGAHSYHAIIAWGFLASEEVKRAGTGNLGLRDQRLALQWVQKYIGAFGGDPTKVTYASFAQHSCSQDPLTPMGDITHGQRYYDLIVHETGCKGSNDTLECLRGVPGDVLQAAVDKTPCASSYQALALAWMPRADGIFLTDNFQRLVKEGKISKCSCDDEGTLFSFSNANITTSEDFRGYLKMYWAPNATDQEIDGILHMYSEDPVKGSPFETGHFDQLTPQRFLLSERLGKQNIWTYLSKGHKAVPLLGAFHGSDYVDEMLGGSRSLLDYLIRFAAHLRS
ncbi:alpha beta-hydrolase [Suillus lakei]|nr:alpha beta-hydrolase [Suillus lakei]